MLKALITKRSEIERVLSHLALRNERILLPILRQWMNFAQKQIRRDLVEKYQKSVTSELTDWELIESQGKTIIKPAVLQITQTGGNAAYKHLALAGSFDVLNVQAIRAVNKFVGKLVVEVTAQTKKGIRTYIKHGIKEGWSMPKIARELRPLVGLTGAQTQSIINYRKLLVERRPDLAAAKVDKAVMKYTNKTHRLRMENIARTETARAQNIGYAQGLEEIGIKEVQFQTSPDACEALCAPLEGTRYPVDEGAYVIPVHPRCRCAMLPVISDKAISNPLKNPPPELVTAQVTKPIAIVPPQFVPKPIPSLFEAENIGKAEANARRILGIPVTDLKARKAISFKGMDVEAANHVNRGLSRFKKKFPQMKLDAIEVRTGLKNIYAQVEYQVAGNKVTLVLNKSDFKNYKVLSKTLKRNGATNYLVGDSVEDLIAHEMGHTLSYVHMGRKGSRAAFALEMDKLEKNVRFIQKGLSKYATQDGAEGLAEVFSSYVKTGNLKGIKTTSEFLTTEKVLRIYAGVDL